MYGAFKVCSAIFSARLKGRVMSEFESSSASLARSPGFRCNMRLGVFVTPPVNWDASKLKSYPQH